jgi:oxygen-independent coproporphyrinogen-3 oxidase
MSVIRHLYVHVPFCTHICPYCAFYKTRNLTTEMKDFVPSLLAELKWARENFDLQPETIFFGGGTPTALSVLQLEALFAQWPWREVREFTFEANPLTISPRKAEVLRLAGVNRISLGAQAFDEPSLKILGRTHQAEDIRATMAVLRRAGFDNINLDLMFALPGQTFEQWQSSLLAAVELQPEHISAYNLNYEEDTEFFDKLQAGVWRVEESHEKEFFGYAEEFLAGHGFDHYEISNYARNGFESVHNHAYWLGADYLGLGPGACSTVGLQRWKTVANTQLYGSTLMAKGEPLREMEPLTANTKNAEKILLGLRTREGAALSLLADKRDVLTNLEQEGLITLLSDRATLTTKGKLVADSVTELLI